MPPENLFDESADDTRSAIMEATYHALVEHGYAGLSIQRIADEFDKSKSLLYHHYDGKDELLVDFLEFVLGDLHQQAMVPRDAPADEQLRSFFGGTDPAEPERSDEFVGVFVELRAQAVQCDDYQRLITRTDEYIREYLAAIIEDGIEEGSFREVDPDRTATFLVSVLDAVLLRRTTTDDPELAWDVLAELDDYLETRLYRDD
ncbi:MULTISPECIES: TetR/AcrR family transcriptional regulator [Halorussus]|uniref:TetR/AcrR family transcriptional regulator n=1 Tax=Halorussus TaxID=1070314 RepID=UPI000E20CC39|nr:MULTISPECIES: TetR/AcrR family transcriptional regulator [Halorussus]NHN61134.1 TetR/AcrR family transcriptional regulator [Halorussus sp. JP-T4]